MKKVSAFTLSELMIALVVLGILCAIVLPAANRNNPNQNKMMMKKAYSAFNDIVSELINDGSNYPVVHNLCPDNGKNGYIGFDCGETDSKLPYLFSQKLNSGRYRYISEDTMKTDANYSRTGLTACNGSDNSCYLLKSDDKMTWAFSKKTFTKGSYTSNITIGIDVNGDKKPNCYQGSTDDNCKNRTENFDQFRILLYTDGKIKIDPADTWAMEAISVSSALTD